MYKKRFLDQVSQFLENLHASKIAPEDKLDAFKDVMQQGNVYDMDKDMWDSLDEGELLELYEYVIPTLEDYFSGKKQSKAARLDIAYASMGNDQRGYSVSITRSEGATRLECASTEILEVFKSLIAGMTEEDMSNEQYLGQVQNKAPERINTGLQLNNSELEVDIE